MMAGDPKSPPGAPPPPASAPPTVPNGPNQLTSPAAAKPNNAAATSQTFQQTLEQQGQRDMRYKALPGIMAAIQVVPGNRPDRWVQAIFATNDYPTTLATLLNFSAMHATQNIFNPFTHAVEVTLSHQSLSRPSAKDKGDLVACVQSLLLPDTPICFDTGVPFPKGFEAFKPQIIGLQHSTNLRAGVIHHRITVGFALADARDAALATPPVLTWHLAKARLAKAHHFYRNMVELRINVGVSGMPSKEEIVTAFQFVVQHLRNKGYQCQLVQVLRVTAVDNATAYAHTVGDFSAFVHFDDATLFQPPTTILAHLRPEARGTDILPSRMDLCTRGIDVTAICHNYEKEAACVRCHFVGHMEKCPVVQERKRKEVKALVRKGVREGAGVGAEEGRIGEEEEANTTNNINTFSKVVAAGQSLGTDMLELQNRFAGLEVEGG
ncbi:BQ5605_C004g03138 [Microbotryum silenes-dioicae]|uniref:BQ5605_C004g03138 protein n=1 Tax=Microbotryum silenes-dioicae TaxID=796604 RepID=A0A2X0MEF2_9BASI|nr:BQ5605_C004g03138 [Microbotryum silenes-dioicae]